MKRAIPTCALIAAGLLTLFSLSSSAENTYYRWVDDRGDPVHSDRPPPQGIEYEVITTGSSLIRQVDAEEGAVPAETTPTVGNEFEQVETGQVQIMKKNPEYCRRARENLETLETSARIRLRDEKGDFRLITEEEKQAQRAKAEDLIAVHCN